MRGGGGEWKILYGKRGVGGWMEDAVRVRSCQEKGSEVTEVVDGIANSSQIPHQARECEEKRSQQRLLRLGMLTAVTLTAHNFPEGMAVAIRYARAHTLACKTLPGICSVVTEALLFLTLHILSSNR